MIKSIPSALILLIAALFIYAPAYNQPPQPVPVIFDTDMGPDYDDVGAIAMLHAMADNGECTILATIASNKHPYVAGVLNTPTSKGRVYPLAW